MQQPILNLSLMWHHALLAAAYMDDNFGFALLIEQLEKQHEPPVSEEEVKQTVRTARNAGLWPGKRGKVLGDFGYAGFGWGVTVYKGQPYPCRTGIVLGVPLAEQGKNPQRMLDSWAQNELPMHAVILNAYKTFLKNAQ